MGSLPAQPISPMREQLQRDARDILLREDDPSVVRALYTATGSGKSQSAEVLVRISDGAEMRRTAGRLGPAAADRPEGQQRRRVRTIQVAAPLEGETIDQDTGVGDQGGVAQLRERDQLLVPGWIVGAADEWSVVLIVSRVIGREVGHWTAEVGT